MERKTLKPTIEEKLEEWIHMSIFVSKYVKFFEKELLFCDNPVQNVMTPMLVNIMVLQCRLCNNWCIEMCMMRNRRIQ